MGKVRRMFADRKYHNRKPYEWVDEHARWGLAIIRRPEGSRGWVKLPTAETIRERYQVRLPRGGLTRQMGRLSRWEWAGRDQAEWLVQSGRFGSHRGTASR
jgi:hypothetical protein